VKITKIENFKCWIEWCNWLFVKVSTDEGLHGWGEGSLHGADRVGGDGDPRADALLIGKDPSGPERHWQAMYHAWRWRGGPTLSRPWEPSTSPSGTWKGSGSGAGLSAAGRAVPRALRGYASHWLVGADTPEKSRPPRARRSVAASAVSSGGLQRGETAPERGGGHRPRRGTDAAAREAVGPRWRSSSSCGEKLSPHRGGRRPGLCPYRPGWFEEPIPFEKRQGHDPPATGDAGADRHGERLLSRWSTGNSWRGRLQDRPAGCDACGGHHRGAEDLQPGRHLLHPRGPAQSRRPICMLAACTSPPPSRTSTSWRQMEEERPIRDALCTTPVQYRDGFFELPTGPGLGTDLKLEVLTERAFRPQPVSGATESYGDRREVRIACEAKEARR